MHKIDRDYEQERKELLELIRKEFNPEEIKDFSTIANLFEEQQNKISIKSNNYGAYDGE